jgi:hydrogenase maturation protein HypF
MDKHLNSIPITEATVARRITLSGKVQGVGFRPFIYRLASAHQLNGWVKNGVGLVEIHVEGESQSLQNFINAITKEKPPLAQPVIHSVNKVACAYLDSFSILPSDTQGEAHISLPSDLNLCDDCLGELTDPTNRRYRYPFINCTQCGPRYTLITRLPYDRPNTTMGGFPLCEPCLAEYLDPGNRRFHAEPIACPDCGPALQFHQGTIILNDNEAAMTQTIAALRRGETVAVKGIGGYHLMCDATNEQAVERLRQRKSRPDKPLAVIFPSSHDKPFASVEKQLQLNDSDKAFLLQPSRPILLVAKRQTSTLSNNIAPDLNEVGVMLPYSPLHHLLLNDFGAPLVATSGNISGEPVLTEEQDVERRLSHIADAFLHHNRPIERPADDPVYRTIADKPRPMRMGRGTAPVEITLPFKLERPVLAVGSQMKNVITLGWEDRAVISPHIGEMHSARSLKVFENTIADLQKLYNVEARQLICDAHPGYTTSRWARKQGLALHTVLHHHAHASAAYYECDTTEPVIAFTWDGIGYGEEAMLWGGETFIGRPADWKRVASINPFKLPGGEKASREPWRSAAGLCWQSGLPYPAIPVRDPLLHQAWERGINAPQTTSVGRLFDGAVALMGLCTSASYEGEGAMRLEAMATPSESYVPLELVDENGLLQTKWLSLIRVIMDDTLSVTERASLFHASLAQVIVQQGRAIREKHGINIVTLSGGVFQNSVLTEQAITLLSKDNFVVRLPSMIPVNDAGISFGQVMEFGFHQKT